jgi:hypothetical protein
MLNFLIGFRSRLVTFQRGTRLITGISSSRMEDIQSPQPTPPTAQLVRGLG